MVMADGDFVSIKAHRPPPQHVVTWKKRKHEALAEAAQHQFRGVGHMREEQRECMMRCMAHARRVYREVAQSIYGPSFAEVARFLDGGPRRRSIWQRARQRLEAGAAAPKQQQGQHPQPDDDEMSVASRASSSAPGGDSGPESEWEEEWDDDEDPLGFAQAVRGFVEDPPGLASLLPCAVIYPNMHPLDRPELLKMLLAAVQQRQLERVQQEEVGRRSRRVGVDEEGVDEEGADGGESTAGEGEEEGDDAASVASLGSRRSVRSVEEEDDEGVTEGREATGLRALPPIAVVIRSARHQTLASILRDVCTEIVAAVRSLTELSYAYQGAGGARARREAWRTPAPQGTLGEVMAAYASLVEGVAALWSGDGGKGKGKGRRGKKGEGAKGKGKGKGKAASARGSAKAGAAPPRPPLLLLFEDVEALGNRLLEDLLRLLAEVGATLPSRLVFLVSPAFALAQSLGCGATATLEPQTFLLPPAQAVFDSLLSRLFLDAELPVMISGRVLRLLRVTFRDHHNSITTFIRHLDFLLRVHFSQLPALLAMLPYDLVPEEQAPFVAAATPAAHSPRTAAAAAAVAAAAAAASAAAAMTLSQDSTASGCAGHGRGNPVLVMTKAECGQNDSHSLMVIRNMEALFKLPQLRPVLAKLLASASSSSASASDMADVLSEDHCRQFQCLRLLVNQQLAARFELRIGCHILRRVLCVLRGPQRAQEEPPSPLHLAELLLDHDRPQRWRARERECLDRLAQASLEDLEDLVLAWLDVLREEVAPMPLHARRFSKALNVWIPKARELWLLLSALGGEMKGKGKGKKGGKKAQQPQSQQPQQENDAAAPNAPAASEAAAAAAADAAKDEEEEARRQYRIKSQGIAMDAQAFLSEVAAHCLAVGAAAGCVRDCFWFRDTQALQDAFFAQPRAKAVKALTDSHSFLQCACCPPGGAGDGWLHPAMPDVCLVYGLYEATQGRTLNIRTWFASFVDVICGGDEEEEEKEEEEEDEDEAEEGAKGKAKAKAKKRKRGKADSGEGEGGPNIPPEQLKALWARFLHAVDELEHLGFTRPYGKRGRGDRAKLLFAYTLLGSGAGAGGGAAGSTSASAAAGGGE